MEGCDGVGAVADLTGSYSCVSNGLALLVALDVWEARQDSLQDTMLLVLALIMHVVCCSAYGTAKRASE